MRLPLLVAVALVALYPATAYAEPSAPDRALAQSLFDEARELMSREDYAAACPKFAHSQKLDPGGGTLLNLAVCHEKQGRTATAWTEFNEALGQAVKDGRSDREVLARERIDAIAPRLPRLRIVLPADARSLTLFLDGESVETAGDVLRPIDPGPHLLEARAPGRETWSVSFVALPAAPNMEITVPVLAAVTSPDGGGAAGASGRTTAAFVVGGIGLVSLGLGAVFGVQAIARQQDSDALCPTSPCANVEGVMSSERAVTSAWISNVAVGVGLVAVGASVYLLVTSPSAKVKVAPTGARSGAGLAVTAEF